MAASKAAFASPPGRGVAGEHPAADAGGLFDAADVGFGGREEQLPRRYASSGLSPSTMAVAGVVAAAPDDGAARPDVAVDAAVVWRAATPVESFEPFALGRLALTLTAVEEDLAVVDLSSCL